MIRRSGSSLVEVLVAIFVMGLGLIALLTLFPIGMLRMAEAIRNEKCSTAGQTAHTIAILNRLPLDPLVLSDTVIPDLFTNPYPADLLGLGFKLNNADPLGESYAVMVDPLGYASSGGTQRDWVGGSLPARVPIRRPVSFTPTVISLYKSFTIGDDIKFENTYDPATRPTTPGTPYKLVAATNMFRDVRYSWAYLLRRPQTSEPGIVECTVMVFDSRDTSLFLPEFVYPVSYYDTARNAITINYTNNVPPPVRPGNWLLDATVIQTATAGSQHAYFYKIVSAEEFIVGTNTLVRYEVATPLRGVNNMPVVADPLNPAGPMVFQGTTLVLDGLAEVFEKGPTRMP